ncbi:MAG TPA: energy transducer TonB [bacterium]|nr:energy transducer TonB [bacterium]
MKLDENRLIVIVAAILSLMLNLALMHFFNPREASAATDDFKLIELVNLPKDEVPEAKEPEKKPEPEPSGQIVDLGPADPNDITPPPDHARYLSERNMRVEQETIKPSRSQTGSPGSQQEKTDNNRSENSSKGRAAQKKPRAGGEREASSRGKRAPDYLVGRPVEVAKNDPAGVGKSDLKIKLSDLSRSMDSDNGSVDYIPSARLGNITCVDSRQYTYASFFNRFKKVLAFFWRSDVSVLLMDYSIPEGKYITVIDIAYNRDGSFDSAMVLESSGIPILDAATIKAARKTAPIYDLPPQLIDSDGRFKTRFGFIVEIERREDNNSFPR